MHISLERGAAVSGVTPVQNLFIMEYMPKAPEGFVKVYLYGLMLAGLRGFETLDLPGGLGISEAEALEAFLYWQEMGLVRIVESDPLNIEYRMTAAAPARGSGRKYGSLIAALNKYCRPRVFAPQELSRIYDWIEVFGMDEATAVMLVRRCMDMKGAKVSIQYMDKAARGWADEGILTPDLAEQRILMETELNSGARAIYQRWRKSGRPTEDETELYRKWTEDWGMTHEEILAACPAMTAADKPTFAYLNGILETMRSGGGVREYLSAQNAAEEIARQMYIRSGIQGLPTRKEKDSVFTWLNSWHMEAETALYAAELSAGVSRPFSKAAKLMESWHEKGITTLIAAREHQESALNKPEKAKADKPSHFMNHDQRRYSAEALSGIGINLLEEDEL
ncbi:MAG: DnaD domain protein [Clostridia bacterium]|nr:DnaD domain protein [Clostridia bacterium]